MGAHRATVTADVLERPDERPRVVTSEFLLFAAATAATWLHTIDEVRIGELIALPFGMANVAVLAAWGWLGRRWRAAAAIAFGLFWGLAVIPYHVLPLLGGTVTGQHVSGLSRLVGGAAMVALGIAIIARRRSPSDGARP